MHPKHYISLARVSRGLLESLRAVITLVACVLLGACATGMKVDTTYTSENQDSRVLFLVLHYTQGNFESSLKTLTQASNRAVSSHYLVRDDPVAVYRLVDESQRAWHAGASFWKGHNNLNASSIGIEIVNLGWSRDANGTPQYAPYSDAQIDAVIALCKDIVQRHKIKPERIIGHSDIAPGRKQDPGPLFPWKRLAQAGLIAWPDEAMVAQGTPLYALQLPDARWFQGKLADHGFNASSSGEWDALTRDNLVAFQMKYRPRKYDGQPDAETAALLDVVNRSDGMRLSPVAQPPQPFTSRW